MIMTNNDNLIIAYQSKNDNFIRMCDKNNIKFELKMSDFFGGTYDIWDIRILNIVPLRNNCIAILFRKNILIMDTINGVCIQTIDLNGHCYKFLYQFASITLRC